MSVYPEITLMMDLTLKDVHDRLQLKFQYEQQFEPFLTLQPLTVVERDRATELRQTWERYYIRGKVSEGQVNLLAVSPLLWSTGYVLEPTLQIGMEEKIAEIAIEAGETLIQGRMDLVITRLQEQNKVPLCVLIIEAKNSAISPATGLAQLLTYAGSFLAQQDIVLGLVTNGIEYQFVHVEAGLYRQFRSLTLFSPQDAETLFAVAIAIRQATRAVR
ncbi:MAG: restriction endonuclease subunit R [Cyanobacteria bacterium P01_G01_bin.54]